MSYEVRSDTQGGDPFNDRLFSEVERQTAVVVDRQRRYDHYVTKSDGAFELLHTAASADGNLDFFIESPYHSISPPYTWQKSREREGSGRGNWNGLLTGLKGHITIPATTPAETDYTVLTTLRSSPKAINAALTKLGRTPGRDTFMLDRVEGSGLQSPGAWTTAIASGHITVADLVDFDYAEHDTSLDDHLPLWFVLHAKPFSKLINTAEGLLTQYGETVHYESTVGRPNAVNQFVEAIDGIAFLGWNVTSRLSCARTIDDCIWTLNANHVYPVSAISAKRAAIMRQTEQLSRVGDPHDIRELWFLVRSGLLLADASPIALTQRYNQLTELTILTAARMMITAEEVQPNETLTLDQRNQKLDMLNQLEKKFTELATA